MYDECSNITLEIKFHFSVSRNIFILNDMWCFPNPEFNNPAPPIVQHNLMKPTKKIMEIMDLVIEVCLSLPCDFNFSFLFFPCKMHVHCKFHKS
jgi:hypothetical protein